jgi:hypothetical protein
MDLIFAKRTSARVLQIPEARSRCELGELGERERSSLAGDCVAHERGSRDIG